MTDRERLIELIRKAKKNTKGANCDLEREMLFADYLLKNGVVVPPCKVGERLYFLYDCTFANRANLTPHIYETNDWYFDIDEKGISILTRSIRSYKGGHHYYLGKTVFLTREEAEKTLKDKS